jgi:hypothetical protein
MTNDATRLDRKIIVRSLARTAREGTANLAVAVKAVGVAGEAADLDLSFGIALHVRDLLRQKGKRRALAEAGRLFLAGQAAAPAATGRNIVVRLPAAGIDPALHGTLASLGMRRNRRRHDVQEFTGSADVAVVAELIAAAGGCVTAIASPPPVPDATPIVVQTSATAAIADGARDGEDEPAGTAVREPTLDSREMVILDRPAIENVAGRPTHDERTVEPGDIDSDTFGEPGLGRSGGHGSALPRDRLRPRGPSAFQTVRTHVALASEVLANRRAAHPGRESRVATPLDQSDGSILEHDAPAAIADASRSGGLP